MKLKSNIFRYPQSSAFEFNFGSWWQVDKLKKIPLVKKGQSYLYPFLTNGVFFT